MKKTEGKRTSVAEYVRKRACGESAGPGKEEVLPVCEKSAQQEEVKSDLELLQACCKILDPFGINIKQTLITIN